jgi:hypothetical protein
MPGSGTGTSSSHSPGSDLALTNAGMVGMSASLNKTTLRFDLARVRCQAVHRKIDPVLRLTRASPRLKACPINRPNAKN